MEGALDRVAARKAVSIYSTFFGVNTMWLNDLLTQHMIWVSHVWRVLLLYAVDSVGV